MNLLTHTLPITLQQARKARRLSQLTLSLRLGVSQRHISFVESGRAKPSRALLLAWLQELDAPLSQRNAALLQAGYAPAYNSTPLDDPALAQVRAAMLRLLHNHDPMPAFMLDAHWNVLHANRGGQWLTLTLVPWLADWPAHSPLNLLDLMAHPDGLVRSLLNLPEVGPTMLAMLRAEAVAQPQLRPKVEALAALLHQRLGSSGLQALTPPGTAPVLTSRFATEYGELAFFSMFTTFGTPQDITLASIRVEHMFAADAATAALLTASVVA